MEKVLLNDRIIDQPHDQAYKLILVRVFNQTFGKIGSRDSSVIKAMHFVKTRIENQLKQNHDE